LKRKSFFWRRVSFLFGFSVICMLIVSVSYFAGEHISSASGGDKPVGAKGKITVIIDAGHGGRDGGASTESGVLEKDLNLAVALKLRELVSLLDADVVMTRETDVMLADESSAHKKRDDLNARLATARERENCIFVSIHMNKFPVEKYSGLQVYYSGNNPESLALAEAIQARAGEFLRKGNARTVKKADSSIYILHHIEAPAVLVECGFLSNPEEAALLGTEEYQNKLAAVIFAAVAEHIAEK